MKLSRRKILLGFVALVAFAALAFVFAPNGLKKRGKQVVKRQWLILTGRLVDIGGHRLRIECIGTGSPTVVMDAGLNQTLDTWGTVPQEIAKFTRVCTYERAGLGESDKVTEIPRTSERIVEELHTLLQNAGEQKPFLLVGHSFGGFNTRLYASRYPQEVAGLVLVDSSHENQYERYAALKPPGERENYLRHEGGANDEHIDLLASANEMRNAPPLPSVPLVVLTAQRDVAPEEKEMMQAHDEMQSALARLLPESKLVVVQGSGHFIQKDKPEMVVDAIRGIYEITKNPRSALTFSNSALILVLVVPITAVFFSVWRVWKKRLKSLSVASNNKQNP